MFRSTPGNPWFYRIILLGERQAKYKQGLNYVRVGNCWDSKQKHPPSLSQMKAGSRISEPSRQLALGPLIPLRFDNEYLTQKIPS